MYSKCSTLYSQLLVNKVVDACLILYVIHFMYNYIVCTNVYCTSIVYMSVEGVVCRVAAWPPL